jgi:hypothetical protein
VSAAREERNARARIRYALNRVKELQRQRIFREANRQKLRAIGRLSDARPERKAKKAEAERTGERKATRRAWRSNNIERHRAYHIEYERRYLDRRRELHNEKQATDPQYRLRRTLRSNLHRALGSNRKGGSAVRLLGCSVAQLRRHLEAQWVFGMTWDNFGRLTDGRDTWQIDHIRPLSSFDLTDTEQLSEACHYTNLAPLWAIDNRRKANKVGWQTGGAKCPLVGLD